VTVRFEGEDGLTGRLRIAVRGDTVHATLVTSAGGIEPAGDVAELRRLLVERGFADARVAVQDAGVSATTPAGGAQAPRDDARREAFARAHDERASSDSQGRHGRERPRHSQEERR
jgi:hypothetical protein